MALLIKRITDNAIIPTRGSAEAAGLDLYASEGVSIGPGRRAAVSTGISIELPKDTYGRIAPRSGLAVKDGINVGAGVVDRDYTGEIKVVLFNHGRKPFNIKSGYKIAQLIVEKCVMVEVKEVEGVAETARGANGFGSTGIDAAAEAQAAADAEAKAAADAEAKARC